VHPDVRTSEGGTVGIAYEFVVGRCGKRAI
jgi:hypothetical protein